MRKCVPASANPGAESAGCVCDMGETERAHMLHAVGHRATFGGKAMERETFFEGCE